MKINISDKAIFFGAGCGIGLALGALLAPRSGSETRQNLSHKVDDLTHKVQEKIQASGIGDAASRTWTNVVEKGKNVASIGKKRVQESVQAGMRRYNEMVDDESVAER
jgi:gas vesicle protein